jgi:hypothetical protein
LETTEADTFKSALLPASQIPTAQIPLEMPIILPGEKAPEEKVIEYNAGKKLFPPPIR